MKHSRIIILLFLCAAGAVGHIVAMQQQQTLPSALENLSDNLTTLELSLQPGAAEPKAAVPNPPCIGPKCWKRRGAGAKGHHHDGEREKFRALQQSVGITPPAEKAAPHRVRGVHHRGQVRRGLRHGRGARQVNREHYEKVRAVRSELNTLLSKDVLSNQDVQAIQQKINVLNALDQSKPIRWPKAVDYQAVLDRKKGKK